MKKLSVLLLLVALNLLAVSMLTAVPRPDSPDYDAWKRDQIKPLTFSSMPNPTASAIKPNSVPSRDCPLLIPLDDTFTLALSPNDDGYTSQILLPFTFSLYGADFTSCWVNNNGNVTFNEGLYSYTPWGFPSGLNPMLAPFFADVDTRGSGTVSYKIETNRMTVIWDHVGYFPSGTDKLNTFELIFTNGTDPTIGLGNNVAFSYADMAWTTGSASGGSGGFGGYPATVGNNRGDNIGYSQIGRFDHAGIDYDGPYANNDGVDWLDCQRFFFNTGSSDATLTIYPSTYDAVLAGVEPPAGSEANDPFTDVYYASYPAVGTMDIQYPVGPGNWRGWIYYGQAWHQADVYPVVGPGTVVFSDVPFNGTSVVPFLLSTDDPTLPVELSSFTAVLTAQNYVKLSWVTESETNMNGYNIFRNDTADYADAAFIGYTASSNSSTQHVYSHTDNEVEVNSTYYYWLQCVDFNGSSSLYGPQFVTVTGTETPNLPNVTSLKNAYPNPFKTNTSIDLSVKEGENATVTIYNILGQSVMSYDVAAGNHTINWDGKDSKHNAVGSGIYFYRLSSPSLNETRKMMIVK